MAKSKRFDEVLIQPQSRGDRAGNLRDLDGVGEAVTEMVGKGSGKDLCLMLQPAERSGMDDAVPVSSVEGPIGMGRLGIAASPTGGLWEA